MKKFKLVAAITAVFAAALVSGCSSCNGDKQQIPPDDTPPDPPVITEPEKYVSVAVTQTQVTIKDYEAEGFNFARYFRISDDGKSVSSKDYVDYSAIKSDTGEYLVTCTYKQKTATLSVRVVSSSADLRLSSEQVRVKQSEVENYDFKSLFDLTVDGNAFAITDAMIKSDVRAQAGKYEYTVNFFGTGKTLTVIVYDEFAIEIIDSYGVLELTKEDLNGFDYTKLFSVYVGGVAQKVLPEHIDASALDAAEEGQIYAVRMTFSKNDREKTATAQIKVVEKTDVNIIAHNQETYPNGESIDLKALFTVKRGDQIITVTDDMISGTVDYSKEGDNLITLNYGGREGVAIVSIKLGVIIDYAASDTVIIAKGTDKSTYDFGADFKITINGIPFGAPIAYFDISAVDFSTVGTYIAKLTIPYNTKPFGWDVVNFDNFEKTITYKVVEKKIEYSIDTLKETVILPSGTAKYDVYGNLRVVINGIRRVLCENAEWIDITTCYVQTTSSPIDFTSAAEQTVKINVYVFGPDAEPVEVEYRLRIDGGVEIKGKERIIFSGTTVYARELFEITEKGKSVDVTDEMVSGKIDLFNAGIYYVTASYKGVTAVASAVVLDASLAGKYKTLLWAIEAEPEDDSADIDYGWDVGAYALSPDSGSVYATATLKDIIITDNGEIYIDNQKGEILSIIDATTFNVKLYNYEYVLRYGDGVITLDPVNSEKLTYNDRKRPLIYFNESVWTVQNVVQINSSSNGYNVLQSTSTGNLLVSGGAYSIDCISVKSTENDEIRWYGMKTMLIGKYTADTFYADEIFGFATFSPEFERKEGCVATVNLGGAAYEFTMTNSHKGKINKVAESVSPYAGTTFKRVENGKTEAFSVATNDKLTYTVDGKKIFELTPNDLSTLKNSHADYSQNTWLVYNMHLDKDREPYSYRFRLDKQSKSFTIDERDDLFGRYVYKNVCFFFDGYGTGEVAFDTASKYNTTAFSYKRYGTNIEITYLNPAPQFAHGKTAKFIFADYKNILTVREIEGINLVGCKFINAKIYDGAIVEVRNFVLGKGANAKNELYEGISITNKDGALSLEQLKNGKIEGTNTKYVDMSAINGGVAGYYQLKINIPVDGTIKPSYYAVQVLDALYKDNALVGRYAQTAIASNASVTIDEYGRIYGTFADESFKGIAVITGDKFTGTAQCATGNLTISGKLISNGIVEVTARGALAFYDCFTTGAVKVCGTKGYVLRAITANENSVYMLSLAQNSLGNVVTLTGDVSALNSIIRLNDGTKEYFIKISAWGDATKGLTIADAVRGVFTKSGSDDLILDGFGSLKLGSVTGTYTVTGSAITAFIGQQIKIYRLDVRVGTYTDGATVDASLFAGKSFTADYFTFCAADANQPYATTTTFEFKANGIVSIKSSSAEHDEGCIDKYACEFTAENGTYSVSGNKVTISANGKTIVFSFNEAVALATLNCYSTTVTAGSHGYFAVGQSFVRA